MAKLLVSLSMAYAKKDAISIITSELIPVAEHLTKIYIHSPSKWDKKWEKDISSFFPRIIRVANNLTGGKKLSVNDLSNNLVNCVDDACDFVLRFWNKSELKTLSKWGKRTATSEAAYVFLKQELHSVIPAVITKILTSDTSEVDKIAELLAGAAIAARTKASA